jgi:ribosome-associated protein
MVKPRESLKLHTASQTHQKPNDPMQIAKRCAFLANEKKAENIHVLDVSKLTSFADSFVICSAGSERQAQAIARQVMDAMREEGVRVSGVEGLSEGHWILVDLGDVIFHVFTEEARDYYDLDGFWADAPVVQRYENAGLITALA